MKTLHLFAGAGGGLLADLILGHEPVCAVEWDAFCCAVLRERAAEGWFPGLQVFEGDVRLFPASEWRGFGVSLPKPYYNDEKAGIVIYNADCREILPSLEDKSIDFVFTDPPYGHNNNNGDLIHRREEALGKKISHGSQNAPRPIANDGAEAEPLVFEFYSHLPRLLKSGCCCCCCCGGGGPDPMFARWSLELDKHLEFKQMVVWDKGPLGMGWHYRRSYETVLVGMKRGGPCKWYDTTDKIENIIRPGQYGIRKIIPSADDHPTPKPVELPSHFIRLHSERGDVVLDPFCGSGVTLRAAKDLGRKAIGIEIEERWCELAVKRLAQEVLF